MLDARLLEILRYRFYVYVNTFYSGNPEIDTAISLKKEHSYRVCREIRTIAEHADLTPAEIRFAEMTALFHDIGRFEQYARHRTFRDDISVDHASLGAAILMSSDLIADCSQSTRELALRIVEHHSRADLPRETAQCLKFLKLLRDADKIDIWRILTDEYDSSARRYAPIVDQDLRTEPSVNPAILRSLVSRRPVRRKDLRTLNDFKLLQVGWIYDVHHTHTLHIIRERRYLERLRQSLPHTHEIDATFTMAHAYLENRRAHENTASPVFENNRGATARYETRA